MKKLRVAIVREGDVRYLPVPDDPRLAAAASGGRVVVTIGRLTFRAAVTRTPTGARILLTRKQREAAGVDGDGDGGGGGGGEAVLATIAPDVTPAHTAMPADLLAALSKAPLVWKRWCALGSDHQAEQIAAVTGAQTPELRARRIAELVRKVAARTRSIVDATPPRGTSRRPRGVPPA